MLTTYEQVTAIPGFENTAARPPAWVNALIGAADSAIKRYCKQDLELAARVDYYDGQSQRELVLREKYAWLGSGYLDPTMQGVALPQATVTVLSTAGFHPGTAGNPNAIAPTLAVQVGLNQWTTVTYTGTTATTFTGCSGGSGVMMLNPGSQTPAPFSVYSPAVWFDPTGYGGANASGFQQQTLWQGGSQWQLVTDRQGGTGTPWPAGCQVSKRSLLRCTGGAGTFYFGWQHEYGNSKLAGSRLPCWPRCDQGIKVAYTCGFLTVPFDLAYAAAMLVCQMVRVQPSGTDLSSQNLGAYSYSVLTSDRPEMGTIRETLSHYREKAWTAGN